VSDLKTGTEADIQPGNETSLQTGTDLLGRLEGEACNHSDCPGQLERRYYKGTDAVVCTDCAMPFVRLWGR
jgi:hypothetical protein